MWIVRCAAPALAFLISSQTDHQLAKQSKLIKFIEMRDSCKLLLSALAVAMISCAGKPRETFQAAQIPSANTVMGNLVSLRSVVPDIVIDLRYTTGQNVTGSALYPQNMPCFLNENTAAKLRRAQQTLRSRGLGLKVWDAWRPPEVRVALYGAGAGTGLFVDPREAWSKHCAGIAVDVTLVDASGLEVPMPSTFDEVGPRAKAIYQGKESHVRKNLALLQGAMLEAGFEMIDGEWWHFDDADYHDQAPPPVATASALGIVLPQSKR
jgi:D-alanyl-D-alanine dipeptidase